MQILRDDLRPFTGQSVLTIGKFDGIHRGHQAIIGLLRERATALGVQSALVTFDPHPAALLRPDGPPPLLTSLDEKSALLAGLGLDLLVLLTFDRALMQTRAADFLARLAEGLRPRELWLGEDFALGHKREGDLPFIRAWGEARAIAVHAIPLVAAAGGTISGSRIRALLGEGAVAEAAALLGRPPALTAIVQQGDQRGRTLGFPTANLLPSAPHVLPANGVYATRTTLPGGDEWPSVTNVGTRPTFEGQRRQVECHLLDWAGDLYGQRLTVHFLQRLREERRFAGIELLRAQIHADAAQARQLHSLPPARPD